MKEGKIDFSSLDPSRNARKWDAMIQSVVSRTHETRERSFTIGYQLVAWAKPAMAMAAAAAIVLWVGATIFSDSENPLAAYRSYPTIVITQLAVGDASYSSYQIVEAMGNYHVED